MAKTGEVKFVYVPNDIAPNFPQNYTIDENTLYFVEASNGSANLNRIYLGRHPFSDASVTLDNLPSLVNTIIDNPDHQYTISKVGTGEFVQDIAIDGRTIVVTLGDVDAITMAFPETDSTIELGIGSETDSTVVTRLGLSDSTITRGQAKLKIRKPNFTVDSQNKSLTLDFGDGVTSTVSLAGIVTDADAIQEAINTVKEWTNDKLDGYATKDYVQTNFVTNTTLDNQLTQLERDIANTYASTDFVQTNYLSRNDAQDTYVQKTHLISNYYSKLETYNKQEVDQKIASAAEGIDLSGYQRVIEKLGFAEEGKTSEQVVCNGEAFVVTDGTTYHTIHTNIKIATDSEVDNMINEVFNS